MKVLYLTNIPVPYRVDFFNELGKFCDLTVIYERHDAKNRENNWLNLETVNYNAIFLNGQKVGNDSSLCFNVIQYLNKKYDLIIIGGYSTPTAMLAIIYMNFRNIKFILNADGGIIKNDFIIIRMIKKYFISSAHSWLSTSNSTTDYLVNYGANRKKIYIYPFTSVLKSDILLQTLDNEEKKLLKQKLNIKEEKIIISVGQFIPRKGFDILLKASKTLNSNIGIYIIGGVPTKEYIDLFKQLKLENIYFVEFKKRDTLCEYYKVADLFVLPTREDIWGLVINEAMAYGLPIITTNKCVAGIELIRDNYNGYIIPTENPLELNCKIKKILENEGLQKKMSINNLYKSKKYSIENMAQTHYRILKKILRSQK